MKKKSIVRKILVPIVIAMFVQAGLFCGAIYCGGTISQLKNNAFVIMDEKVTGRKNYIQSEMVQRWSNINESVERVNADIGNTVRRSNANYDALTVNSLFTERVLQNLSGDLIYMLRRNGVTGAFVVFEGDSTNHHAGLYIRDTDPTATPADNSDLLLERAPAALSKQLHISTDTDWSPCFFLQGNRSEENYYLKPFQAAFQYPNISYKDLGYWNPPFHFDQENTDVITYSVPLIANGKPYGVLGVDISLDFIRKQLPCEELFSDKKGCYVLGIGNGEDSNFSNAVISGPLYRGLLGGQNRTAFASKRVYNNFFPVDNSALKKEAYGCIQYIHLYNTNTPFENERWALIGITEAETLNGVADKVQVSIMLALVLSLVIGFLSMTAASTRFSRPIVSLVGKLKESNPNQPVQLKETNILEIDKLASAIESLSRRVADSASKISTILKIANVPIGVFEYDKRQNEFFYTERFLAILHLENEQKMTKELFDKKREQLKDFVESTDDENHMTVYAFNSPQKSWARLQIVENDARILGVVTDITVEMQEKKRIEYERDYDILTALPNRRAFQRKLQELFLEPEQLKTAAFLMLDLDNLKYINDTYGHDFGDAYIRSAAVTLSKHSCHNIVVGRMSGDEFYLFLFGFENKQEAMPVILQIRKDLSATFIKLANGKDFRIRVSGGIAWYPEDAETYEQISRFADFAMYKAKNTSKGEFAEFDRESYQKDSYLLSGSADLDKLIEERLVEYYFQPIVEVRTAAVYGYEALMRSKLSTLKSPAEILMLARIQCKLYHIEKLTFFQALSDFNGNPHFPADSKIFINSISNQVLTLEDAKLLEAQYSYMFDRIVLEFTEEEQQNESYTKRKRACMKKWNIQFALDDYGTGYNGGSILLNMTPDYIKIDTSIVRDIDKDTDRRQFFQNVCSYAKERKIKIVAEGVETREEMETLILSGADYLQGYYLGRPYPGPAELPPQIRDEILQAVRKRNLL